MLSNFSAWEFTLLLVSNSSAAMDLPLGALASSLRTLPRISAAHHHRHFDPGEQPTSVVPAFLRTVTVVVIAAVHRSAHVRTTRPLLACNADRQHHPRAAS
eukprot:7761519-Heterocapsa_arctica.AAC.1